MPVDADPELVDSSDEPEDDFEESAELSVEAEPAASASSSLLPVLADADDDDFVDFLEPVDSPSSSSAITTILIVIYSDSSSLPAGFIVIVYIPGSEGMIGRV